MDSPANDYPDRILDAHEPPHLSLYQPPHRHHPDNQQDPIRFKNLVKTPQQALQQQYPSHAIQPRLLAPFQTLADDYAFWQHTLDSLAVLSAPGLPRVYRTQQPIPELAIAAGNIHAQTLAAHPLSHRLLPNSRPQPTGNKLFEENRDARLEVGLNPNIPQAITEALGEELAEPHQAVASYGTDAGGPAMGHGYGAKKDEVNKDTERFFRVIGWAILKHYYSQPSDLPLILAALPEYHGSFRRMTHSSFHGVLCLASRRRN